MCEEVEAEKHLGWHCPEKCHQLAGGVGPYVAAPPGCDGVSPHDVTAVMACIVRQWAHTLSAHTALKIQ